jgi:hypothetical protein
MNSTNLSTDGHAMGAAPRAVPSMSWRYDGRGWTRDLRIDFLRGVVFVLLFTVHFNFFSWMSLLAWERVGVVSSAEMFILLAGIVTGAVYGKKLRSEGLGACTIKLFSRAWTLYKTAVIAAGLVALLRLAPWLDMTSLTTFADPVSGTVYPLYPGLSEGFLSNLFHVLVLAASPHQFQIVGLYVVLFLFTPVIFWALSREWTHWLLLASWMLYAVNYLVPEQEPGTAQIQLTVAQFEYAFPILAWQLLFVHGVVAGYHRHAIAAFFATPAGRGVVALCLAASVLLALFSLNHPLDQLPAWSRLHFIAPDVFNAAYQAFFLKYKLGPGRVLNIACLLVASMAVLTVAWRPIYRALGWLFIPLGQESMYVFFMHVFLVLLVFNTPLPAMDNVWINTAIHLLTLLACWVMVKTRFLFGVVPH